MVLHNEVEEIMQKHIILVLCNTIYTSCEALVHKDTLPTSDRVRADDGMYSCEIVALVQQIAADALAEGIAKAPSFFKEELCVVSCCQAFEEDLHGWRKAVVDLIA